MSAVLAAAPQAASMSGLPAALIVAAAVTALVALGMMMLALHRRSRLTIVRSGASVLAGLAVVAVAALGVVSVSPSSALAAPETVSSVTVIPDVDADGLITDFQLPTLGLDD